MVLLYDPLASYFTTARTWANTVLPHTLGRREFWMFMTLHIGVNTSFRLGWLPDATVPKTYLYLDWNYISIITGMTTFFEVFYTMSSFSRYMHMYDVSSKIIDEICGISFLLSLYLQDTEPNLVRLSSRYLLSSVIVFFSGLRGGPSDEDFDYLVSKGLLKPPEKAFLQGFDASQQQSTVLQHLVAKVIKDSKFMEDDKVAFKQISGKLTSVRENSQEIVDTLFLALPFQYFHLLNIMIQVNLVLWAYGMALSNSVLAPCAYFFASCIFMGLMELANQLADPFGEDETDFPIDDWMQKMIEVNIMIIERPRGGRVPEAPEFQLPSPRDALRSPRGSGVRSPPRSPRLGALSPRNQEPGQHPARELRRGSLAEVELQRQALKSAVPLTRRKHEDATVHIDPAGIFRQCLTLSGGGGASSGYSTVPH